MERKICNKCGIEKDISEFYKDKQKKDGYSNTCKKCKYKKKDIDSLKQIKRKELEDEYMGNRFGFLTVLKSVKRENCNHILYECLCDCGKTVIKRKTELKTGKATSCGCNGNNILIGKKYGKLTVISDTYHINKRLVVDVLCECGNKKTVLKQSLENGSTLSCGCYNKECHSGENNKNWKGGITSLSNHLRVIIGEWKKDTIEFYNGKCDITGERSEIVHHLYGLSFIIEEMLKDLNIEIKDNISCYSKEELGNIDKKCIELHYKYGLGVCLTEDLHKEFHSIYGYGNNTPQQYYEFKNNKIYGNNTKEQFKEFIDNKDLEMILP